MNSQHNEWFRQSFGDDYLLIYKHRDWQRAAREVQNMMGWLNLTARSTVLDLCCGSGRHALAMAEQGFSVTGVDLSQILLQKAVQDDVAGVVKWIQGDMRNVPLADTFDAVTNWFTSFGYFSIHQDNVAVLQEMKRLLKPTGQWIIDFLHVDRVKRTLVPRSERVVDNVYILEERSIENDFVVKQITVKHDDQAEQYYEERVRLYTIEDFTIMCGQAGLRIDRVYGDYEGGSHDHQQADRLIMLGGVLADVS